MKLKELRDALDWSQKQLSQASGVSQTYISELEMGKKQPTVAILRRLASALGIKPSALLDEDQPGEEEKAV